MMPIQCALCKYYIDDGKCKAYPKHIPKIILTGKHDHRKPYKGDNGIRFEQREEKNKK